MCVLRVMLDLHQPFSLQTLLNLNSNTMITDMHQNMLKTRGEADSQDLVVSVTHALFIARQTLTTSQAQTT